MDPATQKPLVFARFLDGDILDEQGRLLFSLLNAFATSGYPVLLFDDLPAARIGKYASKARSLPNVRLTTVAPDRTEDKIYLYDREDRQLGRRRWAKSIRIRFDVFSAYWLNRPLLMPFPVHPVHAALDLPEKLAKLRSTRKSIRAFFSGEMRGYTVSRITYPTPKLPRLEIINTLCERLRDRMIFVQEQSVLDSLLAADYVDKCVILDTSRVRVRDEEWLGVLSKAEFFIAPPGIVMPMCHNSVEALAVGSVPIINYPEWFDPALEHMRNCIVFDSREDLLTKVRSALAMDAATIATLKAGAIAYYDAHLSNQSFVSSLEARRERRIDLLMLMEEYVRKNAHQLNARSVLVRGKPDATRRSWFPTLRRS